MSVVTRNHEVTTTGFTHTPETIFSGSYYKPELTYGTEKPTIGQGFKKFYGLSIVPNIVKESKNIEVNGYTLATGVLLGAEHSEWSGSGQVSYGDFGCLVDINSASQQQPNAYTLQHYDLKAVGCAVSSYGISGSPLTLDMNLGFIGKAVTKNNNTPTLQAQADDGDQVFFSPNETKIYIDNTEVQRVNAFSFSVDNVWQIGNFINPSSQTILQSRVGSEFSLTEPMETSVWKSSGVHTVRIVNNTVLGTKTYGFEISFNIMWSNPDAPSDTDGMWCVTNKATIIHKDSQPAINITSTITDTASNNSD